MRKLPVLTFFAISRLSDIQSEKFFQILYWRFLRIVKHIFEFIKRNFRYPLFLTLWWPLWPWETKCSIFAAVYLPRIHYRHIIQQLYAMKLVVQDKTRLTSKSGFCSQTKRDSLNKGQFNALRWLIDVWLSVGKSAIPISGEGRFNNC